MHGCHGAALPPAHNLHRDWYAAPAPKGQRDQDAREWQCRRMMALQDDGGAAILRRSNKDMLPAGGTARWCPRRGGQGSRERESRDVSERESWRRSGTAKGALIYLAGSISVLRTGCLCATHTFLLSRCAMWIHHMSTNSTNAHVEHRQKP